MSRRSDSENEEYDPTVKGTWKVTVSVLVSAIIITAGVCSSALALKYGFDRQLAQLNQDLKDGMEKNFNATSKGVTSEQVRHWIDDQREANPGIHWLPLPNKDAAWGLLLPKDMLASKSTPTARDLN